MNTSRHRSWAAALVVAALAGLLAPAPAQEPTTIRSRSDFMRQKLDYAKGLLEGLTLEDYDKISDNARKLKVLSQAAEWEVASIPNVEMYVPYTTEFQRLCDDLSARARQRNIDGATLAYVSLTMNCVNCHKYVRGVKQ